MNLKKDDLKRLLTLVDVSRLSCESKSLRKKISVIVRVRTKSTEDSNFSEDEAEIKTQGFGRKENRVDWAKHILKELRKLYLIKIMEQEILLEKTVDLWNKTGLICVHFLEFFFL